MISKQVIICLDIDDCIFSPNVLLLDGLEDSYEILKINLKRLRMLIEKYQAKIFITSSWYVRFKLENNRIIPKYKSKDPIYYLLDKYLEDNIYGLSSGCRERDIRTLLKENNKVVTLDDMDLSFIEHRNHMFCLTDGLITNSSIYKIYKFLTKERI